ncbi:MAG: hypothetical protein KUG82_19590 [Pseudomonadales bacterium]|nr:hypothetical protein [Pseudomonadales bacterium]
MRMLNRYRQHRIIKGKIRQACVSNAPQALKAFLLDWIAIFKADDQLISLLEISTALSCVEAKSQLMELDRTIYATQSQRVAWDGVKFWQILRGQLRFSLMSPRKQPGDKLPSLYPREQ